MKSLTYLMLVAMKNHLKNVFRSPAKLIAYALGIALFAFLLIQSMGTEINLEPTDSLYLKGIFFGFFLLSFVIAVITGLKGVSPYQMQDVNLLFPSPIWPRTILLYGMLQALKTVVFGSWFIIFQAGWLRSLFGVDGFGLFLIWVCYLGFAFICELLRIFLYAFTHDAAFKKRLAGCIVILVFLPLVLLALWFFSYADFDVMAGLTTMLSSRAVDFTPFIGWAAVGTEAIAVSRFAEAAIFLGLMFMFGIAMFLIIYKKNPDYYEHTAGATQTAFQAQRDALDGDIQSLVGVRENVKVKGTGLFGFGSSTFFGKHLRESLRAARFGLWGFPTLVIAAIAGGVAWFNLNENASSHGANLASVVIGLIIYKFFVSGTGRGVMETYSHYIYLVPESPFKKWVWANMEQLVKALGEAVIVFIVVGFITLEHPVALVVSISVYISFNFYMLGINLAFMRFTGIMVKSPILAVVFMILYIVPALPGTALGVFVAFVAPEAWALVMFGVVFTAWLTTVGAALFGMSKGILHNCDLPSVVLQNMEGGS